MNEPVAVDQAAYRRVATRIRDAIRSGAEGYTPGARLPSIAKLVEHFDTPRKTVEPALRLLVSEGLLTSHKGSGYNVSIFTQKITRDGTSRYQRARREQSHAERQSRGAFETELRTMGLVPKAETTVRRVAPPAEVAEALDITTDEVSALVRARVMYAVPEDAPDARPIPVQLADSYFALAVVGGTRVEDLDPGPGGSISRMAELGYSQASIEETVNVRPPSAEECKALRIIDHQWVYELVHIGRTAEGRPVEAAVHIMPCHLWTLRYSWAID
ncbi:GntR family transcriptional regulator [Kitasatospora aureofaciens]|uniref:GntR family transcriptional regulator n=1 Tax=Kitasatospora aureofaciens TaxID=1894 RepID=UPI001C4686EF|nr:GntR family transcriptional regulator [Kitasatospora aureofaciens]MBV6700280.1 GntR family transcriptional regulator [Kitasatospora aureofaciens]